MTQGKIISDVDYDQFKEKLIKYMQADPQFSDYDFSGSGLNTIMKILATHGVQQGFMGNMLFNEAYFKTAEMYENVASRSAFLSYTPSSMRSAYAYVNVKVRVADANSPNTLTITPNTRFVGNKDGKPYFFSVLGDVISTVKDANDDYHFENVKIHQGSWVNQSYTVAGDAIDTYVLGNENVDTETLTVNVRASETDSTTTAYALYRSAFDLASTNNLYFMEVNRNGLYTVEFGDGVLSNKPDDLNIVNVKYMVTDAEAANGIGVIEAASTINGYGGIEVTVVEKASSGSTRESIESIKFNAPIAFASGGVGTTSRDYKGLVKDRFPRAIANSWGGEDNTPPLNGYIVVAVKPHDKETLSAQEKAELTSYIEDRNVGSILARIVDVDYYYINLNIDAQWNPTQSNFIASGLRSEIRSKAAEYSRLQLEEFGEEYDNGKMSEFINGVDNSIVKNVISVEFERRFLGNDLAPQSDTLKFYKSIKPSSVVVSGFTMDQGSDHIEIKDDGKGSMFMYRNGLLESETVFGSVDYLSGVVTVSALQVHAVVRADGMVSVKAVSDSFDQNVSVGQNVVVKIEEVSVKINGE